MEIGTRIGTVRIRSTERDTPALRLAVSARLGGADPHPPGLPPAAILVVRSLAGRLRMRRGSAHSDPLWERALRAGLADLARRATRPDRGWIAPGSEAILFTDEAEMLACLALDAARGEHLRRWWWRTILRTLTVPDLAPVLIEQARAVPAAFACLARWDEAARVVRALSASEATRVLEEMVRVHDLSPELLVSEAVHPSTARGRGAGGEGPSGAAEVSTETASSETAPPFEPTPAPWSRWLPASQAAVLAREQERLLGIALVLHLAPTRVRSSRFALEARWWWQDSERQASSTAQGMAEDPVVAPPPVPSSPVPLSHPHSRPSGRGRAATQDLPAEPEQFPLSREGVGADGRGGQGVRVRAGGRSSPQSPPEADSNSREAELPAELLPAPGSPHPAPLSDDGFPTRLGGVLYLINLIEHCKDQKDDKDSKDEVALESSSSLMSFMSFAFASGELGPWGLLELLARALLGPLAQEHGHDPLWPALAELDGRAPGDRLDPALSPWLTSFLPAIQQRLEEALGVEPDEIAETLLLCPGRIYVTSSHVDLVAGLDRISLPVRRAGLDRDPGWVPRFGRVVLFHFE